MFKKIAKIVLTTIIVFSVVLFFNNVYKNKGQFFNLNILDVIREKISGVENKKDCSNIIEYSLGNIDKNFGLSGDQFLKVIREAEGIWERGVGRELFKYSTNGKLKINLVFDQRQEDTTRMREILNGISSDEDKLKAVKEEYNKITAEIKQREEAFNFKWAQYQKYQIQFEELADVYSAKIADYEKRVASWGGKGGPSKKEYDRLLQDKADIDALYEELNSQREVLKSTLLALDAERKEFNNLVSQVNTIAGIFNRLAEKLNVRVVSYNEVQGSKDEFVSGLYTSDANWEKIEIFQFYDNKDLAITLAHELGHALGLGHATASGSIMYPKAEGQKTELSKEDLQMLFSLCNQR